MLDLRNQTLATMKRGLLLGLWSLPLLVSACGGRTPLDPPGCLWAGGEQTLDFGEVAPGASAQKTANFANLGAGACQISNLRLAAGSDPGFAFFASEPATLTVPAQQAVGIPLSFTPADGWPPLDRSGVLAFDTNDPSHPHVEVNLTARILSTCRLVVSPSSVDFGHVALDSSRSAEVHLENQGDGPCAVAGLGMAAGGDAQFTLDPAQETAFTLAPGEQRDVTVFFRAVDPAPPHHRTAQLTCRSTDPSLPTVLVPLSADIDVGCWLVISPASVDFGNVMLNTSVTGSVTLGNEGTAACAVSGIALAAGTDPAFSLGPGQALAFTVEPGAQSTIPVRFDAFDSAPPHLKTGTLVFQTGNPRAPDAKVPLSGYVNTVCVEASQWIYTIDTGGILAKFDPSTLTFTRIATLSCPTLFGTDTTSPNSMAVDQNAVAWVAYWSGNLYKVDTTTGKCESTSFEPNQHGIFVFGMGFVFDPTTGIDTLYICGGSSTNISTCTLATVSFPGLRVTPVGTIDIGLPELTGTGDGQMWGFIPAGVSSDRLGSLATLARFDPATAKTLETHTYKDMTEGGSWATKFWGGSFWIFINASVYQVLRDSPDTFQRATSYPYGNIVGAGVSTCAPVQKK
jgi:hypothetical protein